jgi:hypothetical protein
MGKYTAGVTQSQPYKRLALRRTLHSTPCCGPSSNLYRRTHPACVYPHQVVNTGLLTARLVFLLLELAPFEVQYAMVMMSFFSVALQVLCFDHLRSSASPEKRIFLAQTFNRPEASDRCVRQRPTVTPLRAPCLRALWPDLRPFALPYPSLCSGCWTRRTRTASCMTATARIWT